jgi:hypothetical protein
MNIINKTYVSNSFVKDVISFVMPNEIRGIDKHPKLREKIIVELRIGNGYSGATICDSKGRWHIQIHIASNKNKFPYQEVYEPIYADTGRLNPEAQRELLHSGSDTNYLRTLILSKEEALVHTMAHEFRHLYQLTFDYKRGSDKDADTYAI